MKSALRRGCAVAPIWLVVAGCQTVEYYGQAISGEWRVLESRVSVDELRRDPATDPALSQRLATAQSILDFATARLALPAEGRYRTFADVGRGPVVWNVFAAGEFSMDAHEWCYPIVGCAAYRGYFHRDAALREASRRARAGDDVRVSGVTAYSTLGWFHDPLLSSFIDWPDADLAGLLVHELAHVELFVKGDTEFDESYATFVEREGVREWIAASRTRQDLAEWEAEVARDDRFARFMLGWRAVLARLYAQPYSEFARRLLKTELLASIGRCYEAERSLLGERSEMTSMLGNADFVPWAAYEGWVPAFERLFLDENGDWRAFHRRAAELGRLGTVARRAALQALADRSDRTATQDDQIGCESLEASDAAESAHDGASASDG